MGRRVWGKDRSCSDQGKEPDKARGERKPVGFFSREEASRHEAVTENWQIASAPTTLQLMKPQPRETEPMFLQRRQGRGNGFKTSKAHGAHEIPPAAGPVLGAPPANASWLLPHLPAWMESHFFGPAASCFQSLMVA